MRISLIVPVYNAGEYLKEFLNSVKAQTFTEFEAVLVDDGSTDGSAALLDEYAKGDGRAKVIHKENGGVVSAWKRGVNESSGEYIAFADPDDAIHPDMLKTQYELMTQNDADMVVTGVNKLEGGKPRRYNISHCKLEDGLYEGERLEQIKRELFGTQEHHRQVFRMFRWNKMYKRALIVDNLGYTDDEVFYGDDICMVAAAVYDSRRLYVCDTPLYTYRIREGSITTAQYSSAEADNAARSISAVIKLATAKGYMNEHITLGYPAWDILRLARKICIGPDDNKHKKRQLKEFKRHPLVRGFSTRASKAHVSKGRRAIITLLKLGIYSPIIKRYLK